jgi:uncharacterized membrane protein
MPTTVTVILIVFALLIGITVTLRTTARSGMPSQEVLERARKRSRELEARERAEQDERD